MNRISIHLTFALLLLLAPVGCAQTGGKSGQTELRASGLETLDPAQRAAVEAAMEQTSCTCGRGSLATCRLQQPACPRSERALAQAVELARLGQDAEAIGAAIAAAPTARTAPLPTRSRTGGTAGAVAHPNHDHAHPEEIPLGNGKN